MYAYRRSSEVGSSVPPPSFCGGGDRELWSAQRSFSWLMKGTFRQPLASCPVSPSLSPHRLCLWNMHSSNHAARLTLKVKEKSQHQERTQQPYPPSRYQLHHADSTYFIQGLFSLGGRSSCGFRFPPGPGTARDVLHISVGLTPELRGNNHNRTTTLARASNHETSLHI